MLRRQKIERMTRWKGDDEKRREETRWRMDNRKSARRKVDERGVRQRDTREDAGSERRTGNAAEESWNEDEDEKRDETETDRESARELEEMARSRLFGGEWMLASLSMDHLPFLI